MHPPVDTTPPPAAGVTLADFAAKPGAREAPIASLGLEFTAAERALVFPLVDGLHAQSAVLDKMPDPALPVKYSRERGSRPADADNTLGAWHWRSTVKGAAAGPLAGTTVALKDNIFLAGVPMMVGSSVFEGFVPDEDATVATRLLDAGAQILGKAVCADTRVPIIGRADPRALAARRAAEGQHPLHGRPSQSRQER